ncbi:MAG: NAD-dependent epimerase/dehydratase family protein [Candidatus Thorarchaeota archaeon]
MKILVTGATGFIGRNLVSKLVKEKHEVKALVRKTSDVQGLPREIQLVEGDLLDSNSLERAVKETEIVFHLAALFDFYPKDVDLLYQVNVEGTRNLIKACEKTVVKRFIYCSTSETTGVVDNPPATEETEPNPMYEYGKSKILAENEVREGAKAAGFDYIILRPVGITGPGEFYLGFETYEAIANKRIPMIPGDGQKHIMFMHVDDLVEGFLCALKTKKGVNDTFLLCTDDVFTYEELFQFVAEYLGVDPPKRKVPVILGKIGVGLIGFFKHRGKRTYLWHAKTVDAMNQDRWYSNEKAKRVLGWKPSMTMAEAFRRTMDWYISEGYLSRPATDEEKQL